ncbi:Tm-1-like ATP-binding domain-containing protein [Streptomyces sp. S1D4-11]|nr:Tm-1-like ATP-binding domain-containing protein [Streptomyces sp. S1D4-11]QIZ00761.1 UPF0261 family protein [Streptomyces sp. S1D4-11]
MLLGSFDTKGEAYRSLSDRIASDGVGTQFVDMSVAREPTLEADIPSSEVARAAGAELASLHAVGDRGVALATMTR